MIDSTERELLISIFSPWALCLKLSLNSFTISFMDLALFSLALLYSSINPLAESGISLRLSSSCKLNLANLSSIFCFSSWVIWTWRSSCLVKPAGCSICLSVWLTCSSPASSVNFCGILEGICSSLPGRGWITGLVTVNIAVPIPCSIFSSLAFSLCSLLT